jgi:two-component system, NarL family, response regulator NreC
VCSPAQIQQIAPASRTIRCVLVHDHILLRQGIRRLLGDEPDIHVVAEATNGGEALQQVMHHQPDIVIIDAHTFDCSADRAEQLILEESPHSKVFFVAAYKGSELPQEWLTFGESCALRQTSAEELVEKVRKAVGCSVGATQESPRNERGPERGPWAAGEIVPRRRVLTAREREVLKLLAEGKTVRSVAGVLGLSVKTVDSHKFNLMRKLGIHNKAELVMWAIQKRVVKLPAI